MPIRDRQPETPLSNSSLGRVKTIAAAPATKAINSGFRLAAVALDVEFVGVFAVGAAERHFLGQRMRQIDDVGRGDADFQIVDLILELVGDVRAAVGPRRRGGEVRMIPQVARQAGSVGRTVVGISWWQPLKLPASKPQAGGECKGGVLPSSAAGKEQSLVFAASRAPEFHYLSEFSGFFAIYKYGNIYISIDGLGRCPISSGIP